MSSPVLITGGAGYVGSATACVLAGAGRPVVVLDDLSTGHAGNVRWGPLVEGDIADGPLVLETLRTHGIRDVLHFAARALVGESMRDPALYDRENRQKTEALLATCREAGVHRVVFSSSCAVYGVPAALPLVESHPLDPVNPYGASKAACEAALAASGMSWMSLRYFNAAGALPEEGLGERHDPETHLIPLAIRAARTSTPLTVFGTDHETPDGTCVRDYVHVQDLADGHVRALRHLAEGGVSAALNLGTGRGVSVREVLRAVSSACGVRAPTRDGPPRAGDPPALVADATAAAKTLGWVPQRSGIDQIVADALRFEQTIHP